MAEEQKINYVGAGSLSSVEAFEAAVKECNDWNSLEQKSGSHVPAFNAETNAVSVPHGKKPDATHWIQFVGIGAFQEGMCTKLHMSQEISYDDSNKPSIDCSQIISELKELKKEQGDLSVCAIEYCTKDGLWCSEPLDLS